MDFVLLLSTIILVSIIVTLLLTLGSYMAFRFRERRRPRPREDLPKPKFFRRFLEGKGKEERTGVSKFDVRRPETSHKR